MIDGVEALVITNEREIIRTSGFGGHEVEDGELYVQAVEIADNL